MTAASADLVAWRRHLHTIPELGFAEHETAAFVAARLAEMGWSVAAGVGGTGVVGTLQAGRAPRNGGPRAIALRADMDALPIAEAVARPHASRHAGRMHACGHDGHMAMLLGAARDLATRPDFHGTIHLIFQPAEEHGRGAAAMLADGLLERFPFDEVYGLHNMPGLPFGRFATRPGGLMAAEDNFEIVVEGVGTHAARPHMGLDPLVVGAEIVLALQGIVARRLDPVAQAVVSVTEFLTDGQRNVLPGRVTLRGDTRSFDPAVSAMIEARMAAIAAGLCQAHGAGHRFLYTREFRPTVNSAAQTAWALDAARAVAGAEGAEGAEGDCAPVLASEDFGAFLERVPGNFMFLGSGLAGEPGGVPLHNAAYDFQDGLLPLGAAYFATLARQRLAG